MNHIDRKKEIAKGALPPKGTEQYYKVINFLNERETPEDIAFKKKIGKKLRVLLRHKLLQIVIY